MSKAELSNNEAIDLIFRLQDICKERYRVPLDLNILKELAQEIIEEKIRGDFRKGLEMMEPVDLITFIGAINDHELEQPEKKRVNRDALQ